MNIILNSKETAVPDDLTVSQLKSYLNMTDASVAVAVNGKIVLVPQHDSFHLADGDDVILIGAAYGG